MKFPVKILSRSRWEKTTRLHRRFKEIQLSEATNDTILRHASLCRLKPDDIFDVLDVGANQGDWALAMSALYPKARILAAEADPKTYETLCCRVACREQIRPVNVAIHSTNKMVTFYSHQDPLLSSLMDLPDAHGNVTPIHLSSMRLDDLAAQYSLANVRMIKVDTEGNDLEVLAGAEKLLCGSPPDYVIVEFGINSTNLRHVHINKLIHFLGERNFHLNLLGGFGIYDDSLYGNALFVRGNP